MADMEKRKISQLTQVSSINLSDRIEVSEAQNNGQSYESKNMTITQLRDYFFAQAFPIGSIYMTMNVNDNPQNLFGGTWDRFAQGKTLFGVDGDLKDKDDTYKNQWGKPGQEGGNATMTLDTNTMPQHRHNVSINTKMDSGAIEFGVRHPYDPNNSVTPSIYIDDSSKGFAKKYGSNHSWNTGTVCKDQPSVEQRKGDQVSIKLPGIQTETTVIENPVNPSATNDISLYPPYITCCMWIRTG